MNGIATIDGEYYRMTLPFFSDCDQLMQTMPSDSTIWKNRRTFLIYDVARDDRSAYLCEFLPHKPRYGEYARGHVGEGYANHWRPKLIPVTKNGEPDHFIKRHYKNGHILKGGTLYIDGDPVSVMDGAITRGGGMDFRFDWRSIKIGDTMEGYEIPWMVLDGDLIAERILIYNISGDSLRQRGLLV